MTGDIYIYFEANKLLKDKFNKKREVNPLFSMRSWASQMGLGSHGGLQQVLAGKRTIPKKYIPLFIKSLGLTNKEALYFEALVDFEKAKSNEEKEIYYKRLTKLRPKERRVESIEIQSFKFFQDPLHSIIMKLIDRKSFRNNPEWIVKILRFKTTQTEVKAVIKRLITLGFISNKNGKLKSIQKNIRNKIDVPSQAVQEYHKRMSLLASDQVSKQSTEKREYNSFCLNIKGERMVDAKNKIRQFIEEFSEEFSEKAGESNQTYQFNIQLFSLTNDKGGLS